MFLIAILNAAVALCDSKLTRGTEISVSDGAKLTRNDINTHSDEAEFTLLNQSRFLLELFKECELTSDCRISCFGSCEEFNLTNAFDVTDCLVPKGTKIIFEGRSLILDEDVTCTVLARELCYTIICNKQFVLKNTLVSCCIPSKEMNFEVRANKILIPETTETVYEFEGNLKPVVFKVADDNATYVNKSVTKKHQ